MCLGYIKLNALFTMQQCIASVGLLLQMRGVCLHDICSDAIRVILDLPCLLECDASTNSSHSLQKCFGARLSDSCISSSPLHTPELLYLELIRYSLNLIAFNYTAVIPVLSPFLCTC